MVYNYGVQLWCIIYGMLDAVVYLLNRRVLFAVYKLFLFSFAVL